MSSLSVRKYSSQIIRTIILSFVAAVIILSLGSIYFIIKHKNIAINSAELIEKQFVAEVASRINSSIESYERVLLVLSSQPLIKDLIDYKQYGFKEDYELKFKELRKQFAETKQIHHSISRISFNSGHCASSPTYVNDIIVLCSEISNLYKISIEISGKKLLESCSNKQLLNHLHLTAMPKKNTGKITFFPINDFLFLEYSQRPLIVNQSRGIIEIISIFIVIISLLFVALYLLWRKLFIGAERLTSGIDGASSGNFSEVLPEKCYGLEYIAERYNVMIRSLRSVNELRVKASLSGIVSQLAHDIRKPFVSMKILLEMIDVSRMDEELLKNAKANIDKSLKMVESMICDIVDFSRESKIHVNPVSVVDVLDRSIRQAILGFKDPCVEFKYKINHVNKLTANEEGLVRAFVNIIVNAVEAITIMSKKTEGQIEITSLDIDLSGNSYVQIIIANDGPEIKQENLLKVFDISFTQGKGKGTGLGLASAKRIIKSHDGEIIARNRENHDGVEFVITIPASNDKDDNHNRPLPRSSSKISKEFCSNIIKYDDIAPKLNNSKKFKVVILEDDAIYRAYIRNIIEACDEVNKFVTLYEAQTVEDALNLVKYEKPTHAIVDIDLGNTKNGYDFLDMVDEIDSNLCIMIHSNRYSNSDVVNCCRHRARHIAPKPLLIDNLLTFFKIK